MNRQFVSFFKRYSSIAQLTFTIIDYTQPEKVCKYPLRLFVLHTELLEPVRHTLASLLLSFDVLAMVI